MIVPATCIVSVPSTSRPGFYALALKINGVEQAGFGPHAVPRDARVNVCRDPDNAERWLLAEGRA